MNLNAKTIPLFRFSGATRIEAKWSSGPNWVRPMSRCANRWTTAFFLRPCVGAALTGNRWRRAERSFRDFVCRKRTSLRSIRNRLRCGCFRGIARLFSKFKQVVRLLDRWEVLLLDMHSPFLNGAPAPVFLHERKNARRAEQRG